MDTRPLGSLQVSVVGLGCNNFGMRIDETRTNEVVRAALDAGITLFDTADIYGGTESEVLLGRALGTARDDVIVATKFGAVDGAHPDTVRSACEASLTRLGTDRIDLYQVHRPDDSVPIEDTLGALQELVAAGKVRELGCSNFGGAQIDAAAAASAAHGWPEFVSLQNQLSLLDRRQQDDTIASCERHGLGILPYFPLASGMLTGKFQRGAPPVEGTRLSQLPEDRAAKVFDDRTFDTVEALTAFAEARGRTLLETAMSWLACLPHLASVIAGATSADQVRANAGAAGWVLSPDEMTELDALTSR